VKRQTVREKGQGAAESWTSLRSSFPPQKKSSKVLSTQGQRWLTVDVNTIRAFLPGSRFDVRPCARHRRLNTLEGKELAHSTVHQVIDQQLHITLSFPVVRLEAENSRAGSLLETLQERSRLSKVSSRTFDSRIRLRSWAA